MAGCSTTTPHPTEVAAIRHLVIARTPTPPLRLPSFSDGFLSGLATQYPSLLTHALKPDEEKVVRLSPPAIPDFGEILAQDIQNGIPSAFVAWPTTEILAQPVSEGRRSGEAAMLEVSLTDQYASWLHAHLMTFARITLYSPSGEVLMTERIHVNSLYVQGSQKIDGVASKGNVLLAAEYQLASSEIVTKLTERLRVLGFR